MRNSRRWSSEISVVDFRLGIGRNELIQQVDQEPLSGKRHATTLRCDRDLHSAPIVLAAIATDHALML